MCPAISITFFFFSKKKILFLMFYVELLDKNNKDHNKAVLIYHDLSISIIKILLSISNISYNISKKKYKKTLSMLYMLN